MFSFFDPGGEQLFRAPLQCKQCEATTVKGTRCSRTTCKMLPFCAQHTKSELGLVIKPSRIPGAGLGLFTAPDVTIQKDEAIAPLRGQEISKEELDRRYGDFTAPYGVTLNKGKIEDGATDRFVGHFANTKLNFTGETSAKTGTNARLAIDPKKNTATLKATKTILPDTEILLYYGKAYRFNEGTRYRTAPGYVRKSRG